MSDFPENEIKSIAIKELEEVIAKAISDAAGATFEATISKMKFTNSHTSETHFQLAVSKPSSID